MRSLSENFRFRFNGLKIKASGTLEIDPKLLTPGGTLYFKVSDELPDLGEEVKGGYSKTFTSVSSEPFPDSLKLRIHHITGKSKVVLLLDRYETDTKELYKIFESICPFNEFNERVEKLKELPDDWTGSTEDWKTHPIGFIISQVEKIKTIERLQTEADKYTWFPLPLSGLVLFILCTSIESIGRTKEFIFFNEWIKSRRTKKEIEEAIKKCYNRNCLKFIQCIHKEYQIIYGFRRAFYNFFNNLDYDSQQKLSRTIMVTINKPPDYQPVYVENTLDYLVDYLENFRNSYAHDMEFKYSVPLKKQIPKEWIESWESEYEETMFGYSFQEIYKDGSFLTISTHARLLDTLNLTVRIALWKWIVHHT